MQSIVRILSAINEIYKNNGGVFPKEQNVLEDDGVFKEISKELLENMPDDANIPDFLGRCLAQFAEVLRTMSGHISMKKPTARDLIAYCGTGIYQSPVEVKGVNVSNIIGMLCSIPFATPLLGPDEIKKMLKGKSAAEIREVYEDKRKAVIQKLAESRYDLTDFAEIATNQNGDPAQVVIAAADKGKFLQITIDSRNWYFQQILEKCRPEQNNAQSSDDEDSSEDDFMEIDMVSPENDTETCKK